MLDRGHHSVFNTRLHALHAQFLRPVFVVRITDGRPACEHGAATAAFLRDVADVVGEVRSAEIAGVRRGGYVTLAFRGIPEGMQQRLRNVWSLHRS